MKNKIVLLCVVVFVHASVYASSASSGNGSTIMHGVKQITLNEIPDMLEQMRKWSATFKQKLSQAEHTNAANVTSSELGNCYSMTEFAAKRAEQALTSLQKAYEQISFLSKENKELKATLDSLQVEGGNGAGMNAPGGPKAEEEQVEGNHNPAAAHKSPKPAACSNGNTPISK